MVSAIFHLFQLFYLLLTRIISVNVHIKKNSFDDSLQMNKY
jgi:hypothetical protein